MVSWKSRSWLAALILGYLLFYGVHLAECAYSVPRQLNDDCLGMIVALVARGLTFAPVRWFVESPCQRFPHLNLAFLVPAVLLLAMGYLGALRAVHCRPEAWPLSRLLGWSALAALPLLAILPPTSVDYLAYLFAGRVASVYHQSPWKHTLIEYPAEFNYLLPQVLGADLTCVYGPVWGAVMTAVTALGEWTAPGPLTLPGFLLNVLLLRAGNVAAFLAGAAAVWRINGLLWPRQQRLVTAAFLLNPLLVFEAVGALHNDVWGVAFLLWAYYLFLRNDARFLVPFALSILTKYVAFALAPLFVIYYWRARDWRRLAWTVGTALLCVGLTLLTSHTDYVFSRVTGNDGITATSMTLPMMATFFIGLIHSVSDPDAFVLFLVRVCTVLFLPFYVWLLGRTRTRDQVLVHGLWVLAVYFTAVYVQTMAWYFFWPLGLLCAIRWTRAATNLAWASCALLLSYISYFWHHNVGPWNPWCQLSSFVLAMGLPALAWVVGQHGGWSACPGSEDETRQPEPLGMLR
jgi:hypothetical protein